MQIIADFRVEKKAELYEKINAAVATAFIAGFVDRTHGVLVTRHDFDHFSVALSPYVPYGLIHEQDQAHRREPAEYRFINNGQVPDDAWSC
jgi:hypothetical protein